VAPQYTFVVLCPNGHDAVQRYTMREIRAGAMPFYCVRCNAHWTSTPRLEDRVLAAIDSGDLQSEVR